MTTDREIREIIARCVSIAVFHHNSPRDHHRAAELYEDDVRLIARWVARGGLDEREAALSLLEPLHDELVARYGAEVGSSLQTEFLAAYRQAWRSERPGQPGPARPRAAIRL